jgi:predicted MFS family arabinose efflux permease
MSDSTTQPALPSAARYTLFVLFLINFLNFFDRILPAIVAEPLRREFHLDDTMLGLIGTAFILVYAIAGLPLGRLSDRVRRSRVIAAGVFTWSLMTAATAGAWNLASLFAARLGVGIGEASAAPAANSLIGDLFPAERRARAFGVFMLGLPVGSLACYALGGYLAQRYGWRAPFVVAAIPGLIVAAMMLGVRDPVRGAREAYAIDASAPVARPYRRVLAIPTLWWIIVSGATVNFAAYSLGNFLPALLARFHHASIAQAGVASALALGASGLIGLTAGGAVADRLHLRFARGRLLYGALAMLLAAPMLWLGLTRPAGDIVGTTAFIGIGWLLYFQYYVTVYPSIQDVVEPRLRATAMSVYFFFQYVLGAGFGTTITGLFSDRHANGLLAAAGGGDMTDALRARGLQWALTQLVPVMFALTGIALCFAARSLLRDAARVRDDASPGG